MQTGEAVVLSSRRVEDYVLPLRRRRRSPIAKVLAVEGLVKDFPLRGGLLNRVKGRIKAVDGVSFEVEGGTTFGIAGESGSGKTTLCMTVAKLLEPTSGRIVVDGKDYSGAKGEELREMRSKLQIVFQNPISSLDPHMTVGAIVSEPLKALRNPPDVEREEIVRGLLEKVGLSSSIVTRYPHELSGGQAQRVSIARALSVSPEVVLLDEPTSALDASVQAQVLNMFNELQDELGITYVIVSHDLSVIGHMCDQVAIMYAGRFVETGSFKDIFYSANHPYTAALLESAHMLYGSGTGERFELKGDMPSPRNPPSGCTLNPRCPFVSQICQQEYPVMVGVEKGHFVACHNREDLVAARKEMAAI